MTLSQGGARGGVSPGLHAAEGGGRSGRPRAQPSASEGTLDDVGAAGPYCVRDSEEAAVSPLFSLGGRPSASGVRRKPDPGWGTPREGARPDLIWESYPINDRQDRTSRDRPAQPPERQSPALAWEAWGSGEKTVLGRLREFNGLFRSHRLEPCFPLPRLTAERHRFRSRDLPRLDADARPVLNNLISELVPNEAIDDGGGLS